MTHDHDHDRDVIVERQPIVERRGLGFIGVVAALLVAAMIAFSVWLFFIADEQTRDDIIPDDVDVTVDVQN